MIRGLVSLAVATAGCADHVQLAGDELPGLVAIEVSPAEQTLSIILPASPQTIGYSAVGQFADGTDRDITAQVEWTADNTAPGAIVMDGTYTTSNAAAGHVAIHATHDAVVGTAALVVAVTATIVDDAFPPPGGAELFAPGTPAVVDPMKSPTIVYPADATLFPQGLAQVLFQYARSAMTDTYRLSFTSDVLQLQVLTGSDRWRPDAETWALIEQSHLGAAAAFEVDAASSTAPGTIYTGAPETLEFSATDPGGAIYFGSSATNGIMRSDLATTAPAQLYPPAGDPTRVIDEAVSRDGTTMAVAYNNNLRTLALGLPTLAVLATTNVPMGWAAVSPDGALVVVANMGMLSLHDATTGAGVGSPDGHIAIAGMATHPSWSPDGKNLAVVLGTSVTNTDLKGGSIARIPYLGAGAWGTPQILVASTADNDNNFFAVWSPDGNFIAYVHADGPAMGAQSAELRLVPAAGGAPIALARASHRLGLTDGVPNLADTMPTWSPSTGGPSWLAFGSARPYGAVRTMTGGSQIWIAGVDLTTVASGDPSASAFWLPAQDVTTMNGDPAWTPPVVTTAR